jgi:hypothetical protein
MSSITLKLIPSEPFFTPTSESQDRLEQHLRLLFEDGQSVFITAENTLLFVDSGTGLEQILCPFCLTSLGIDWWQKLMDEAYTIHFQNLRLATPCCNKETSLNDLYYQWPVGFARFIVEIRNYENKIDTKELRELEDIVGCHLKAIYAQY